MNTVSREPKGHSLRAGREQLPLVPNRQKLPRSQLSNAAYIYIEAFRITLAGLRAHVVSQSFTQYGPNLEIRHSKYRYIGDGWEADLEKSAKTETLTIRTHNGSLSVKGGHFRVIDNTLRKQQVDNAPALQLVGLELLGFQKGQSKNYETALEEFRYRNPDLLKPLISPRRLRIKKSVSPQELAIAS